VSRVDRHPRRGAQIAVLLLGLLAAATAARADEFLVPDGRIILPRVAGRIDHMAVDLARKRLVAELGNNTLDVVDLAAGREIRRISGLDEPQGVGYAQKSDLLVVANGGDGSVRFYRGADLAPAGAIGLGSDADDVRIDPGTGNFVVGYGSGGLAIINPETRSKIGNVGLAAHPEGFAIAAAAGRAFVNVPDAGHIAVVDLAAGERTARWPMPGLRANFPIALDAAGTTIATVFREPPTLLLLDAGTGAAGTRHATCGDADDAFFDAKRRRIYVSCGAGAVDIFERDAAGSYVKVSRVETSSGARTSLFVSELDRLYVAVRAHSNEPAAILVFRPTP